MFLTWHLIEVCLNSEVNFESSVVIEEFRREHFFLLLDFVHGFSKQHVLSSSGLENVEFRFC